MRKITKNSINAFYNNQNFKTANTEVRVLPNVTILKLHNNNIAFLFNDTEKTLKIQNCGWFSLTTKERLNGLNNVSIVQKKGLWYLNGSLWNGELITIK